MAFNIALVFAALLASPAAGVGLSRAPVREDELDDSEASAAEVFRKHMHDTKVKVLRWRLNTAAADASDRVAATIATSATDLDQLTYAIRANMHRLGPQWALQVFYGDDDTKAELLKKLGGGEAKNVLWTPITINGDQRKTLNKNELQWIKLSLDFWAATPEKAKNVLVFDSDSLLLRGHGCVDAYIDVTDYDLVGAPWNASVVSNFGRYPVSEEGGSGGLTLRNRQKMIQIIQHRLNDDNVISDPATYKLKEDHEMVRLIKKMSGSKFPSRESAMKFAVQSAYDPAQNPKPCGLDNPWQFLTPAQATTLLSTAED